jgi:hypothetical protein
MQESADERSGVCGVLDTKGYDAGKCGRREVECVMSWMYRICIKLVTPCRLDGPYFGTSIPTTRNKVFIDKPHFLRRFRMPINDHTRMCVSRSIVILNPILTGTSNDFA